MIRITEERRVSGITNSKITADVEINSRGDLAATMAEVRAQLDVWEQSRIDAEKYRQTQVAVEQLIFDADAEPLTTVMQQQFEGLLARLPDVEVTEYRARMEEAVALRAQRLSDVKTRTFGRRGSTPEF